jgi:hypothetical protein
LGFGILFWEFWWNRSHTFNNSSSGNFAKIDQRKMKATSTLFKMICSLFDKTKLGTLIKFDANFLKSKSESQRINPKSTIGFINKNILNEL